MQQQWLEDAIDAAQKGETTQFLETEEGKNLTNYLKENPDLVKEIVQNTELYKLFTEQSKSKSEFELLNKHYYDGSFVKQESIDEVSSEKKVTPLGVDGGYESTVNLHKNQVSYGWIIGSGTIRLETSYQKGKYDNTVYVSKVKGYAGSSGVGLEPYFAYNGDASISKNETENAYTEASFTVGVGNPVTSTGTAWLKTKFVKKKPVEDNSGDLPVGR